MLIDIGVYSRVLLECEAGYKVLHLTLQALLGDTQAQACYEQVLSEGTSDRRYYNLSIHIQHIIMYR